MNDADIENEIRAIEKLCMNGKSDNLVAVLSHGWLSQSPFYYIDMELCETNLETYIKSTKRLEFESEPTPRLLGKTFPERGIWDTWDIVEQISMGIQY